jgi:hypothetical protein
MTGRQGFIAVVAVLACAALPPVAIANAGDTRATLAFLKADSVFLGELNARLQPALSEESSFVAKTTTECPNVLAIAPHNSQFALLHAEVLLAVPVTVVRSSDNAALAFIRATENLRWSSKDLTESVRMLDASFLAEVRSALPNLCSDLRAWVESDYRALPQGTRRFLHENEGTVNAPSNLQIIAELPRLADPAIKRLVHSVQASELRLRLFNKPLGELVKRLVEGLGMRTPGLSPPPPQQSRSPNS